MRQKSGTPKATAERVVNDIRRKTCKYHSAERQIRLRRFPDRLAECRLSANVPVPLAAGNDNAIWARVATLDGLLGWSSPIYAIRA
jgi:hypothetical protein